MNLYLSFSSVLSPHLYIKAYSHASHPYTNTNVYMHTKRRNNIKFLCKSAWLLYLLFEGFPFLKMGK